MKVAIASSNLFYDSAALPPAVYPRERAAVLSRPALLQPEDRTGRAFEIALRAVLGSSLVFALGQTCWQLAHS